MDKRGNNKIQNICNTDRCAFTLFIGLSPERKHSQLFFYFNFRLSSSSPVESGIIKGGDLHEGNEGS